MSAHQELRTAADQAQHALDRCRQSVERERRVSATLRVMHVAEADAGRAADALIAFEAAHPEVERLCLPDASEGFGYWPGEDNNERENR